jgi:hypothetical protein
LRCESGVYFVAGDEVEQQVGQVNSAADAGLEQRLLRPVEEWLAEGSAGGLWQRGIGIMSYRS